MPDVLGSILGSIVGGHSLPIWVPIQERVMDLAESPYATSSIKLSALELLGKNLGMF